MSQFFLAIASLLAGLAVAGGAFASHALRDRLSERALEIFETGIRYQMYHALALLAVGMLLYRSSSIAGVLLCQPESIATALPIAGYAFLIGILLFSGSLYMLSLTDIRWLGAVTPLGGVCLIAGWICLAIATATLK